MDCDEQKVDCLRVGLYVGVSVGVGVCECVNVYVLLQYIAVCCSMLQCVAVCCSVLQCVA